MKQQNTDCKQKIKVVFLGDRNVGKSSMIHRFINHEFLESIQSTIGVDYMSKIIKHQRKKYRIQLWDTAGQQKYRSLIKGYLRNVDACVFVYDCTDINSYLNLPHWIELFESVANPNAVKIIAGNKNDLPIQIGNAEYVKQDLKKQHSQLKNVPEHLVSAKQGTNINEIFKEIIQLSELVKKNKRNSVFKISGFTKFYSEQSGIKCCQ